MTHEHMSTVSITPKKNLVYKRMGFSSNNQYRHYVGSVVVVVACIVLVCILVFFPVPQENKGVIDIIIGTFIAGVVLAMKVITGDTDEKTKEMQRRIEDAEKETAKYKEKLDHLSSELESTKTLLVQLQKDVIKELALLTRHKNRINPM